MNDPDLNFEDVDDRVNPGTLSGTGDYFRRLMDFLPVPVYTCDAAGNLTYFNNTAQHVWGLQPQIGDDTWKDLWKAYTPDGVPLDFNDTPIAKTLRTGEATSAEILIESIHGERRHIQVMPKPLFDRSGRVCGALIVHIDADEKNSLRQQLAASNSSAVQSRVPTEHLHKMIDEVQEYAIIMLDANGNILNWNKGAERIKGYRSEEIIGKNFRQFYLPEDVERQLPSKLIEEAMTKGRAIHEGWRVRKNGEIFWGGVAITAIYNEEGNLLGFTKVTRDLNDRKATEDKIRNYSAEMELKNKELEQFAYIASHDLQEPLRKVMVYSAMLKDNADRPEKVHQYIEKIVSSAERMSSLVQEVLKYARLNNDAQQLTVDLNQILKNALEDYEVLIKEKEAVIQADHLPLVKGYEVQLHQLFANLIGNALKFSVPGRTPQISITSRPALHAEIVKIPALRANVNYNKFTFTDNGQGFSEEFCNKIFKMFQRSDETVEGSGIGLALCQKVVNNHNGYIKAESEIGKGTSVIFYLPIIY